MHWISPDTRTSSSSLLPTLLLGTRKQIILLWTLHKHEHDALSISNIISLSTMPVTVCVCYRAQRRDQEKIWLNRPTVGNVRSASLRP